jgi:hypothetical protein
MPAFLITNEKKNLMTIKNKQQQEDGFRLEVAEFKAYHPLWT